MGAAGGHLLPEPFDSIIASVSEDWMVGRMPPRAPPSPLP